MFVEGTVFFGQLRAGLAVALPALLHHGPFTFTLLPLTVNGQDCHKFEALFLLDNDSLTISETISETVCRLFISSPFILIPQNYLVTIQGEGH